VKPHHRRLLDLIGDTGVVLEIEEFRHRLLDALEVAVPSDWVAINELGPGPEMIMEIIKPPIPQQAIAVFVRYAQQNPLMEHYLRTRDGRARRISDLISSEDFHSREVYTEFYGPLGLEYQMVFSLPGEPDRVLAVILSRRHQDFTDDERDLVETARPFLIQAYRNALLYTDSVFAPQSPGQEASRPRLESLRALGLTQRQAEVLQLIAIGEGEREIAEHLGICPRTVNKHLELCYRVLGVDRRARAAAIAWSTLDGDQSAGPTARVS
jgi:DNA-binding CsgD family transcriptional regulator